MKKLANFFRKFFGVYFLIAGIGGIFVFFTNSTEPKIFIFLIDVFCFYLAYRLLKKSKKTNTEILFEPKTYKQRNNEEHIDKKEPDLELLILENLNRIVRESIEIASKTSNPNTFFSRFDLAIENSTQKDRSYLMNSYDKMTKDFLNRYSNEVINKLLSLKTIKAKENNLSKFNTAIEPYLSRISHENRNILESMKLEWKEYLENKNIETDLKPVECPKNKIDIKSTTTKNFILGEVNTEISINDKSFEFPSDIFELLWFQNGPFANINDLNNGEIDLGIYKIKFTHLSSEPSALDVTFPIEVGEDNEDLGYYPSYERLTPRQRWKYINWLKDIESPIEIGYIFIFYYGLERYIFTDKIDKAVEMIFRLQDVHRNLKSGSFDAYSSDAILIASLMNKNSNWLKRLDPERLSPLTYASIKGITEGYFTAKDIVRFAKFVGWTNNRYVKNNYDLFLETLESIILKKYGDNFYIINREDYKLVDKSTPLVLANYSLNFEERKLDIPDILSLSKVKIDLHSLLEETHEAVKNKLREIRKKESQMGKME